MKVIGITGGIASGKSVVTKILQKRFNYIVIDADQLARQAVESGSPGLRSIVETFGERCLNKEGALTAACWEKSLPGMKRRVKSSMP